MTSFNYSTSWTNQGLGSYKNQKSLLLSLKNKLKHGYESCWEKLIKTNDGKLRTYKLFKTKFGMENYLLCSKFTERKCFSRLRTSSHKLNIEAGRHRRPVVPKELRTCKYCNDNSVEDENHFMHKCKQYSTLRTSLFSTLKFTKLSEFNESDQFKYLMSSNKGDTEIINPVLKFVKEAYSIRFKT